MTMEQLTRGWYRQWHIIVLCWTLLHGGDSLAQCTLGPVLIPDNNTVILGFQVAGLTDGNLSSPTQGICDVQLNFNHEYLGDLTATLISPAGTSVTLIGPSSLSTNNTQLTNWNISFLPCATPAMPDAGFTPVWNNVQPWTDFTFYNGSYHPHVGCLENFNTGPANGLWQLIVQDHDLNQLGSITSFTLTFCNGDGLICSECAPGPSSLSPASITKCTGDNIQSSEVMVTYLSGDPGPLYTYEYLLVQGDNIIQSGTNFSAIPPPGIYRLCGLSYSNADAVTVAAILDDGYYPDIQDSIDAGAFCGQHSDNCVAITVTAPPDTIHISSSLCGGESFTYKGQTYTTTGTHIQTLDGPGLCDTIVRIQLFPRNLQVMIDTPDTLTCGGGDVVLTAMASGSPGMFDYSWSTETGNITTSPLSASVTVNQAGFYTVSVTDGICEGSAVTTVLGDQAFPQVFVNGGTISCTNPTVDLTPIYIPGNGLVNWSGPNGFVSMQPNVTVNDPGTYFLTITNLQGCSTTRQVEVAADTMTSLVTIAQSFAACQSFFKILNYTSSISPASVAWTGPNGFVATTHTVNVSDPGIYTVTLTFANGCQRTDTFMFDGDFTLPDVVFPMDDTLNCGETITLTASSVTPGVSYFWSDGQFFLASTPSLQVQQPGNYYIQVTAPNGCFVNETIEVVLGPDVFAFQSFTDTITCADPVAVIGVTSAVADAFLWINQSGPNVTNDTFYTTFPGLYHVRMTDTETGCVLQTSVFVSINTTPPTFQYTTDTIDCHQPLGMLTFIPQAGQVYTDIYWVYPDLTEIHAPNITSDLPGPHQLVAVGPNGCSNTVIVELEFDTITPFILIESDTLMCADTGIIRVQTLEPNVLFQWSGNGIIADFQDSVEVNRAGIFTVVATGENGCPGSRDVVVDSNYVLPDIVIDSDSLRCDRPAEIVLTSPDFPVTYLWFDETGTMIDMDSVLLVTAAGNYYVEATGANRCTLVDSVRIDEVMYASLMARADTFTCIDLTSELSFESDMQAIEVYWLNVLNDTLGQTGTLSVSSAGPFIISLINADGCETRDTILVPYDTISPTGIIQVEGEIRCQMRDVVLDGAASVPAGVSYEWMTTNGQILSDPDAAEIMVRDTGLYQLVVTNSLNGCADTVSHVLTESPDAIRLAELEIRRTTCAEDEDGSITIENVQGGIPDFLYSLDGGMFQSDPVFDGLTAGTYSLMILDDLGCVYDTSVILALSPSFSVDAGPDQEIHLGEIAGLSGMSDLPLMEIGESWWDSLQVELCRPCETFSVSPWETSTYTYTVVSATGCIMSDEMTVFVMEKGKFYIPNIFSPNGDQINDEVRFYPTPGVERVRRWIIFDRWGNAAYGKTDFDPSDPSVFWNGQTSTGEFANPGVFPYLLEIELINGNVEVHHGDITLIR